MRKTFRTINVRDYWEKRWNSIETDKEMNNESVYPLKYSQEIIIEKDSKILEAGCGAGRILKFYHNQGYDIIGIDYISSVIEKLKISDNTLKVKKEDIKNLSFANESFKYVLAFGLYHGIDDGIELAIKETYRVMKKGGILCASFRADNIQNRINDFIYDQKTNALNRNSLSFHKMNLKKDELVFLFENLGFSVISVNPVVNMPLLYKFRFFRSKEHKRFNESLGRKDGYKLSLLGNIIHSILFFCFADQFCNLYLIKLRK